MGKVRTGLSVSLDGFIAGPNDGPEAPMAVGGERLLAWNGVSLFGHPGTGPIDLESTRVIEGAGVTHLTFRVVR